MRKIMVVDAIMGSGKTSWAVQHMNDAPAHKRFIYITPFNDEVTRIKESVTGRTFRSTHNDDYEGRKMHVLKQWITDGADIVSTHALFQKADDELVELLTDAGYTLILDEVMDVIDVANISQQDIRILLDAKKIEVNEEKRVVWASDEYVEGRFSDIKLFAKAGTLFYHRGQFLIWTFPPRIFGVFDEVINLTYLFDAQIQRYYYELHSLEYELRSVVRNYDRYELTPYDRTSEGRAEIFQLIDLYEGPLNDVAKQRNALSSRWLDNAKPDQIKALANNTYNFLYNKCNAKGAKTLWTIKKDRKTGRPKIRVKSYSDSFLHLNARATNDYADRWALAYVYNRYAHPFERVFFEDRGISVNQDLLAVSDLLQWVWRSRIRKGEPINLYLPSSRMRSLLKAWANYEI
ncbi:MULTISPECIES: hypothetical protein [unclassified Brevibacillus]|uniref:hypothetical protein n=1 Tax=unclassified Brevibacillus TaxID=2684853 RepID=UPI003567CC79